MPSFKFVLATIAATASGPFLYGYNLGAVGTPANMVREFYTKTYATRRGLYPFPVDVTANNSIDASNASLLNETDAQREKRMLKALEPELNIRLLWTITIAIYLGMGMVGALSSGMFADRFGRKWSLIMNNVFGIASALSFALSLATSLPELVILGRVLVGVGSGAGLSLAPLYLSEISTKKLRGPATSAVQFSVCAGVLVAEILSLKVLLGTVTGWPFLFAFTGASSVISVIILPFCPETPRYMANHGAPYEEVRKTMVPCGTSLFKIFRNATINITP
jgi:MFS family permease